jgi:uncharacterized protein
VKPRKISRRWFLLGALLGTPLLPIADAIWVEPNWVKIRRVRLSAGKPLHRLVHFTDLHHKGDRAYLLAIVNKINALSPEFVCFTGDLIEEGQYLPEALELLAQIKAPMYGVPGNHDYWSKAPFEGISKCFAASGGAWLLDEQVVTRDGLFTITGASNFRFRNQPLQFKATSRNIFLMHYPAWVEKLASYKLELTLAGHSHGGQVRFPFCGPVFVPFGVERYDMGLFHTASGPLYVNPGLGWFPWPIRFNCRPEITVFEI